MYPIEVDFEVFKELTVRRESESVTYNDVIRDLLRLGKPKPNAPLPPSNASQDDWVVKGVKFPAGTEFRARYKGETYTARVEDGMFALADKKFDTPSAAAISITNNSVDGWRFWECKLPGSHTWRIMKSLRAKARI